MTANTKAKDTSAATSLPLFYRRPSPLNAARHATHGVRPDLTFDFARQTNAIPLVLEEAPAAAAEYPVVFMKAPLPAMIAVVGLTNQTNLYVSDQGAWRPNVYIPAYVRRYPFIFAQTDETDRLMLCVDEEAVAADAPEERRFFSGDEPSSMTRDALSFCQRFQIQHEAATAFVRALVEHDLLIERNAEIQAKRGSTTSRAILSGLFLVDEAKFNNLPDDVFLDWRRRGWVAVVHAHLLSQSRWRSLLDIVSERDGAMDQPGE